MKSRADKNVNKKQIRKKAILMTMVCKTITAIIINRIQNYGYLQNSEYTKIAIYKNNQLLL